MKALIPFLLISIFINPAHAQSALDSSTYQSISHLPDSVRARWQKVDSIRNDFNGEADGLTQQYQSSISKVDQQVARVQQRIDSLNKTKLPSGEYTAKLDSLQQRKKTIEKDFNSKAGALKEKTMSKLDKIEMTPEMKAKLEPLTQQVNGFSVQNYDFVKIPGVDIPGYSGNIADLNLAKDVNGLGEVGNLTKVETPLGDVKQVTDQVQGVSSDIKNTTQGNLNDIKNVPQTIEQQAAKVDGVGELQKQSKVVDGYKAQLKGINNPDSLKGEAKDIVQKEAVNHFAGKEQVLKEAMDKMSKYKQKYSSVQSIKDLPNRPPNAMKGKPFIERLVPGIFLQYQQKNDYLFDFNPYAGYRLSGRFIAGLGWNQRFAYSDKNHQWTSTYRMFGPRAFLDTKVGKGFMVHLEQEVMNTFVPSRLKTTPDTGQREWVWSTMVGLKKQYKIYKNLNGTVLIQYNLFNPYFKAPYVDRINSRLGFEYTLKKATSKQTKE